MIPFVFLPGAGGRASFWLPVADRLRDLGPCTLFAWPGFGDVPAEPSIDSLDSLFRWFVPRLPSGPLHVVAQSMGGVLATRLAIEQPDRVASLVLFATSGGVDVASLGGADWRPTYRDELPDVPDWFVVDRTDLTDELSKIHAPTLILYGDADNICPPGVANRLAEHIPEARIKVLAGAGHDAAHTNPDPVAEAIRRHVIR